jgi:RNA polymerase sigma-70 factor (ECF subfamily)
MTMNRNIFNELLKEHKDRIFSYACYFLRDREDAEDVTQEVFLRLWRSCDVENRQKAAAWMTRVTHNLCIDWKRRRKTASRHLRSWDSSELENMPKLSGAGTDPERDMQLSQTQTMLLDAMAELPADSRSYVLLHYWQGLTFREIAGNLGVKESTVKVKVHRARKAMRRKMAVNLRASAGGARTKREAG